MMSEPMTSGVSESEKIALVFELPELGSSKDPNFKPALTTLVTNVNKLIEAYNTAQEKDQKIDILKQMSKEMQTFEHRFPPSYYAGLNVYSELSSALFREIKSQRRVLGLPSMLDDNPGPLSELVANMSPEKRNKFAQILIGHEELNTALAQLYAPDEKPQEEVQRFIDFMSTHSIEVLGGFNSRNFKVTHLENGQMEVLKLDNRLGSPKDIEAGLRERRFSGLMPVKIDLPISCATFREYKDAEGKQQQISQLLSSMQVTEYCEAGSLLEFSRQQKKKGDVALCLSACLVMEDMAKKLSELKEDNAIMMDFKPANWLWKDGEVLLGDTKSFMRCDDEGMFKTSDPGNQYYGVLRSPQFFFPEDEGQDEKGQNNPMEFSVEKFNSYVLGINLHCFLRGEKFPYYDKGIQDDKNPANNGILCDKHNAPGDEEPFKLGYYELRYYEDVYDKLINLVGNLTRHEPDDRLSIQDALVNFQAIKPALLAKQAKKFESEFKQLGLISADDIIQSHIAEKCQMQDSKQLSKNLEGLDELSKYFKENPDEAKKFNELHRECKSLEFGSEDIKMSGYTNAKFKEYLDNPTKRSAILYEMENMIAHFNANGITYLHSTAKDLREEDKLFNKGNIQKAENIEGLICSLSPEERSSFRNHEKRDAVLAELARRIGPLGGIGNTPKDKQGNIDDKQADRAYADFKKKFIEYKNTCPNDNASSITTPENNSLNNKP